MSYKWGTYISLAVIFLIAALFFVMSDRLEYPGGDRELITPGYFPTGLSAIIMILCVISFIQTYREKEDKKIHFPHLKMILITLILTLGFLFGWVILKQFYLSLFLFMMLILFVYQPKDRLKRRLLINLMLTIMVMLFVYIVFDRIMLLDI